MGFGAELYKGQKYDSIKKDLTKSDQLFTDPEFPPTQKSLFYSKTDEDIVWKRPTELCKVPKLMIDGATCEDLIEGELGNRWFIVACSSLANYKQLFNKVVPDIATQEYNMLTYRGIFRFQFWLCGRWTEVVIDDYLPTKHGKLVYCHSKTKNEFWSALLEKAYAKLYGDYESLRSGVCVEALVDFTAGVADRHDISQITPDDQNKMLYYFNLLQTSFDNSAIVSAVIKEPDDVPPEATEESPKDSGDDPNNGADVLNLEPESTEEPQATKESDSPPHTNQSSSVAVSGGSTQPKTGYFRANSILRDGWLTDSGLLKDHGYNVREIRKVKVNKQEVMMVRLQSPWGTGEWTGRWSNHSDEMRRLSVQEKNKLGLKFESESEFWMTMEDFLVSFTHLELCHFFNTSLFSLKKKWHENLISGSWVASGTGQDDRAGGNTDHPSFLSNPQYMFDVTSDEDCDVLVSLSQNDRTLERRSDKTLANLTIGFTVMKVEENRKYRVHRVGDIVAKTSYSSQSRSIFEKIPLIKGRYILVPTTKMPRERGDYVLRIYNSCSSDARLVVKDEPKRPSLVCMSPAQEVVQLTIISGEELESDKPGVAMNAVCTVKSEGDSVKTNVVRDNTNPQWNTKFIFFRKGSAEKSPIVIQVMNSQKLSNTSLGEATIRDFSDSEGKTMELSLFQKAKKKDQADIELPGKLTVRIYSSDNLSEF